MKENAKIRSLMEKRDDLQKCLETVLLELEAERKKLELETNPINKAILLSGRKDLIDKALNDLCAALEISSLQIQLRNGGSLKNKALYISDSLDVKIVKDEDGVKCLTIEKK